MDKPETRRSEKSGLSPGTLMHVGAKKTEKARITVIDYDEGGFVEREAGSVEECFPFKDTPTVTWINVNGVHDVSVIEKLGGRFDIHPLVLEDIMTTTQRPKVEDLGWAVFAVLRMIEYDETTFEMSADQLSLVFGTNYVLSFQETPGDCFDAIRDRIRNGKGRIRSLGPDYLAYALIGAVVGLSRSSSITINSTPTWWRPVVVASWPLTRWSTSLAGACARRVGLRTDTTHQPAHHQTDDQHDRERHEILKVVNHERVVRFREEEVEREDGKNSQHGAREPARRIGDDHHREKEHHDDRLGDAERSQQSLGAQMLQARLSALQAQIEPHFPFNTLANVRRLYETTPNRGREMLSSLIDYLRAALPTMRSDSSTLGRELDLARSFLTILQMRMGERLQFTANAEAALLDTPMPPMLLPTLVENAIKHGGQTFRARSSPLGVRARGALPRPHVA